ncbi:MAG: cbb3-type cytochrome c oxidase subunit 3 [Bacteriovoracaceae bacterium]|jgi:cbb3-type cytochrome oxidase subunit 3|nr:cbb3-type cytochrome c oxidase subunit 3 [Bacteriovoracaceae bacterium]
MKQAALSHFDMPWLPISGLIIFVVCFGVYTYWTYKKENKELYDHAAMIPLQETPNERGN